MLTWGRYSCGMDAAVWCLLTRTGINFAVHHQQKKYLPTFLRPRPPVLQTQNPGAGTAPFCY